MKKYSLLRKGLFAAVVLVSGGVVVSSCSKEGSDVSEKDAVIETRASMPDFHWKCTNEECGFPLNGSWRNTCVQCGEDYNDPHGRLIVTFASTIERFVRFDDGAGLIDDQTVRNRVELPKGLFPEFAPQAWFDSSKAQSYFIPLTQTLQYSSDSAYRSGVNTGWYRTTHILYPDYSSMTKIQKEHDYWILGDGRKLKDSFGIGLKAGTKAAIDAFCNR